MADLEALLEGTAWSWGPAAREGRAACSPLSSQEIQGSVMACPRRHHTSCRAWLPDSQLPALWALLLLPTPDAKPVFIYSRKLWKVPGTA